MECSPGLHSPPDLFFHGTFGLGRPRGTALVERRGREEGRAVPAEDGRGPTGGRGAAGAPGLGGKAASEGAERTCAVLQSPVLASQAPAPRLDGHKESVPSELEPPEWLPSARGSPGVPPRRDLQARPCVSFARPRTPRGAGLQRSGPAPRCPPRPLRGRAGERARTWGRGSTALPAGGGALPGGLVPP